MHIFTVYEYLYEYPNIYLSTRLNVQCTYKHESTINKSTCLVKEKTCSGSFIEYKRIQAFYRLSLKLQNASKLISLTATSEIYTKDI